MSCEQWIAYFFLSALNSVTPQEQYCPSSLGRACRLQVHFATTLLQNFNCSIENAAENSSSFRALARFALAEKNPERIRQVKAQHNRIVHKFKMAIYIRLTENIIRCHICCVTTSQSQSIIHLEIDFFFYCIRCLHLTFVTHLSYLLFSTFYHWLTIVQTNRGALCKSCLQWEPPARKSKITLLCHSLLSAIHTVAYKGHIDFLVAIS